MTQGLIHVTPEGPSVCRETGPCDFTPTGHFDKWSDANRVFDSQQESLTSGDRRPRYIDSMLFVMKAQFMAIGDVYENKEVVSLHPDSETVLVELKDDSGNFTQEVLCSDDKVFIIREVAAE